MPLLQVDYFLRVCAAAQIKERFAAMSRWTQTLPLGDCSRMLLIHVDAFETACSGQVGVDFECFASLT